MATAIKSAPRRMQKSELSMGKFLDLVSTLAGTGAAPSPPGEGKDFVNPVRGGRIAVRWRRAPTRNPGAIAGTSKLGRRAARKHIVSPAATIVAFAALAGLPGRRLRRGVRHPVTAVQ
jgi:hypothetical protein